MGTLQDMAAFFKETAETSYCHDGERYVARRAMKYRGGGQPLVDLKRDFSRNAYLDGMRVSHLQSVQKTLADIHLSRFNFVADGTTALCYESGGQVVRFGPAPVSTPPRRIERSYVRDACPLVLQAHHRMELKDVNVYAEVMPFVATLCDSEIPVGFQTILPRLLDQTCFEINVEFKDLAVLPDGTPVYVDPGAINLRNWERQPTQADYDQIRENTAKLGLPEPLSWVLPDGRFKQELFFPAPSSGGIEPVI